MTTTIPLYK